MNDEEFRDLGEMLLARGAPPLVIRQAQDELMRENLSWLKEEEDEMSNSPTKRDRKRAQRLAFEAELPVLNKTWFWIERRTKYHYSMKLHEFSGQVVQVYPSTLTVIDASGISHISRSVQELIASARTLSGSVSK